jgi:hypothetical protein
VNGEREPQRPRESKKLIWVKGDGMPVKPLCEVLSLFIVCPHSYDLDGLLVYVDLVDESVLDVDAARIGGSQ